jgi:23S rRNA pseudouridine2605 synthase
MSNEVNSQSSAAEPGSESKAATAAKPRSTRAKKSAAAAETKVPPAKKRRSSAKARKSSTKSEEAEAAAKAAPKKRAPRARKAAATNKAGKPAAALSASVPFEDPIGDVSDGEAWTYSGESMATEAESEAEAYRAGVAEDAVDGTLQAHEAGPEAEGLALEPAKVAEEVARSRAREDELLIRPPAKLERLQKILSQAGIASRRHAEEMIVAGRVEVNGQLVTALGSKADPQRDHIRVDGKLLHGAERHRYFVLNKPKGYVTTVNDPEGRPTVMEFVQKLGERVYPVGRLDYQSEGLLLMTNDGALANQLTRASSAVEKTYLVKIAGQPDEEELERLRKGVMIERGGPSASGLYGAGGRVRTAPAKIRQIRPGENPWYEVVLTEGRNRELRKMFSAIGHYVEKIRRVGYGPLALDLEPGKLRELTLEEVDLLRQSAEGKLKPRRLKTEAMLPKDAGRTAETRPTARRGAGRAAESRPAKPFGKRAPERGGEKDYRRRGEERFGNKDFRGRQEERPGREDFPRRGSGQSGGKDFQRQGGGRFGGKQFDRRGEGQFGTKERPKREFQGERREWQPRGERPAWTKREEPRRGFEGRREERSKEAENRDFRRQPGKRWDLGARERPFRGEGRSAESRSQDRMGETDKSGGKGRYGGFGSGRGRSALSGKSESGGFGGRRGRGGFGVKSKPGGYGGERSGRGPARPGGTGKPGGFRAGPRPGGRPSGGKRRG